MQLLPSLVRCVCDLMMCACAMVQEYMENFDDDEEKVEGTQVCMWVASACILIFWMFVVGNH